jgi:hypothetical protein
MIKNKYVTTRQYYYGCPCHDGKGYPDIIFFETIQEYLNDVINNLNDYCFADLYTSSYQGGYAPIVKISLDYGFHQVVGAKVEIRNKYLCLKTQDNGSGKLGWVKI